MDAPSTRKLTRVTRGRWRPVADLLLALTLTAGAAGAQTLDQARQAFNWATTGHQMFRAGKLDEAEASLKQAAEALPMWWAPSAILGALYQQRAHAAAQANDAAAAANWGKQAREAYTAVYRVGFRGTLRQPPALPWLLGEQVLTPTRGLLGSSGRDLYRTLLAGAQTPAEPACELPLTYAPADPPVLDETTRQALAAASAELTWEVNEQRLAEQAPLLCPDAWLTLLARAYGLWLWQTETRGQKYREERVAKAFPEVAERLTTKEVLAWAEPRRGEVEPGVPTVQNLGESLKRLLRNTTHRQVLMDTTFQWTGCAVVPAGANAYILQFELATQR